MGWQVGKGGRVVKQQGRRFLVLFKSNGCRMGPRFHFFFVFYVNQRNEGAGCVF